MFYIVLASSFYILTWECCHCGEANVMHSSSPSRTASPSFARRRERLEDIATELQKGVEIKDRAYRWRKYKRCFLGSDAVSWLQSHVMDCESEAGALKLGNEMIRFGFFHHVVDEHMLENKYLFYRFSGEHGSSPLNYDDDDDDDDDCGGNEDTSESESTPREKRLETEAFKLGITVKMLEEERKVLRGLIHSMGILIAGLGILALLHGGGSLIFRTCIILAMTPSVLHVIAHFAIAYRNSDNADILHTDAKNALAGKDSDDTAPASSWLLRKRDIKVHAPKLPPEQWKTRPLYVRLRSPTTQELTVNDPNGTPIKGPLFTGKMVVLAKDIAEPSAAKYFAGRQRVTAVFIQGVFKKRIPFDQLVTGQCFERPLRLRVPKLLVQTILGFLKRIAPLLSVNLYSAKPHLLTPVCASAQLIHVAKNGEEAPDLAVAAKGGIPEEEMENLMAALGKESSSSSNRNNGTGPCPSAKARRKYFAKRKHLAGRCFEPGLTYTFCFFQHLFNPATFKANLPIGEFRVEGVLDRQPALVVGKLGSRGAELWCAELWHERLVAARDESKKS